MYGVKAARRVLFCCGRLILERTKYINIPRAVFGTAARINYTNSDAKVCVCVCVFCVTLEIAYVLGALLIIPALGLCVKLRYTRVQLLINICSSGNALISPTTSFYSFFHNQIHFKHEPNA